MFRIQNTENPAKGRNGTTPSKKVSFTPVIRCITDDQFRRSDSTVISYVTADYIENQNSVLQEEPLNNVDNSLGCIELTGSILRSIRIISFGHNARRCELGSIKTGHPKIGINLLALQIMSWPLGVSTRY